MKKRVLSILLATFMLISMMGFAGCSGNNETGGDAAAPEEQADDKEGTEVTGKAVKIGIINFDYSSPAGAKLKQYLEMLEQDPQLNVSFELKTASGTSDEEHLDVVDALITSGVDGILSYYDGGISAVLTSCESMGVYFALFNAASPMDIYNKAKDNSYYLGSIADGPADGKAAGAVAAELAYNKGYKHIGITSFPQAIIPGQKDGDIGFREKMGELDTEGTVEIYDTHEHFFDGSGIDAYINSHPEMDALFAQGAGLQFDFPTIVSMGKRGEIKLISVGMLNDEGTINEFKEGNIVLGSLAPAESIAGIIAIMLDKLNGNSYPDFPEEAPRMDAERIYIKSGGDAENLIKYTFAGDYPEPMITADDLKELMVTFNEEATFEVLQNAMLNPIGLEANIEAHKQ